MVVNADGKIVLVNAQTEMLLGYTREELLGMPVESLLSDGIGDLQGDRRQEKLRRTRCSPDGSTDEGLCAAQERHEGRG